MSRQAKLTINNAAGQTPEILIYDEIGPDWAGMISGETVQRALNQIGDVNRIVVRINSGGGDVFQGFAIYNLLTRNKAKIVVQIDSLAASAASFIAMAGDEIHIAENAMMMVHNAWSYVAGNKDQLRQAADTLEKIDGNIVATYAARTNLTSSMLVAMMDAETWLTAKESVAKGFADKIGQSLQVSASVAPNRYKNTPERFLPAGEAKKPTQRDFNSQEYVDQLVAAQRIKNIERATAANRIAAKV